MFCVFGRKLIIMLVLFFDMRSVDFLDEEVGMNCRCELCSCCSCLSRL